QFRAFGLSTKTRASRFEAALDVIRRLCAGEEVSMSEPFAIERARVAPVPPEPLEVWIGAAAPVAIDRAARLGDAFLIGPEATPPEIDALVGTYRDACARHGREPDRIAVRRDVHLAATDEAAATAADPIVARGS